MVRRPLPRDEEQARRIVEALRECRRQGGHRPPAGCRVEAVGVPITRFYHLSYGTRQLLAECGMLPWGRDDY